MKVILNTGGTMQQGVITKGGKKMTPGYRTASGICYLNPGDWESIKAPEKVKVSTGVGEVILFAEPDEGISTGEIFIPRGPWANTIISSNTFNTGSPEYKNMTAYIKPSCGEVLESNELMKNYYAAPDALNECAGKTIKIQYTDKTVIKDVVCSVCGAACDDLMIEYDKENKSMVVKNACKMGDAKLQDIFSEHRIIQPQIKINNKLQETDWNSALNKAAEILVDSQYPLFFMGSEIFSETQLVGIEMAEYLGGNVDGNPTICHGPTVMGIGDAGAVTSTMGEVKNRADLIIYWGVNPIESMPRHMSHYAVFPRGRWTKTGRRGRKIIVADPRKTTTAKIADVHIQMKPGTDYEIFAAIRAILKGRSVDPSIEETTGVSIETLTKVADMMKNAKFGALFVGLGTASSHGKYHNQAAAMRLVQDLNNHTKFVIGALRGHANVAGFNLVMAYYSGYPFGVNYSTGYPRYNPGEYTTVDMLARNEIDAVVCVAADLGAHLSRKAVEHLSKIPLITIELAPTPTTLISDVILPGVHTIEDEGTMYRLDNVPLHCRRGLDSPFDFTTSNTDTMQQLFERVKELKK